MIMRRTNAGYFIREGLRGLTSHRAFAFAAIGIIAACLIITGSVSLVVVNLEHNLNRLMAEAGPSWFPWSLTLTGWPT